MTQYTIAELFKDVLSERAEAVRYTEAETEVAVARLRERFEEVQTAAAARRLVESAISSLPPARAAGWLSGARAALRVVLSEARRSSSIIADAARDILPPTPDAWSFAFASVAATRGEAGDTRRAESEPVEGLPPLTVAIDDMGAERRVLATIRDFPADQTPPVMLIVPDAPAEMPVTEVDAEEIIDAGTRRLRYEATLPAGTYRIFLGNARSPETGATPPD